MVEYSGTPLHKKRELTALRYTRRDDMVKEFYAPTEIKEALSLKRSTKPSFYLGGGTLLNAGRKKSQTHVISLHRLALKGIEKQGEHLVIGAMVTLQEMVESPLFSAHRLEALTDSCRAVSRNIRNVATIGGSAASNYSRSDIIPVLIAAGASLFVREDDETEQEIAIEQYLSKRAEGYSPLIVRIRIPIPDSKCRIRAGRTARTSLDLPVVKVAARLLLDGTICKDAVIAAGGLSDRVIRLSETEEQIRGKDLKTSREEIKTILEKTVKGHLKAVDDHRASGEYRLQCATALLEDILTACHEEGGR